MSLPFRTPVASVTTTWRRLSGSPISGAQRTSFWKVLLTTRSKTSPLSSSILGNWLSKSCGKRSKDREGRGPRGDNATARLVTYMSAPLQLGECHQPGL
jgi:hypothetical protein